MISVGNKIREIRNGRGLSLEQLGRATELSSGYLGRLERGESGYTNPSLQALERIAQALEVKVTDLLNEPDAA